MLYKFTRPFSVNCTHSYCCRAGPLLFAAHSIVAVCASTSSSTVVPLAKLRDQDMLAKPGPCMASLVGAPRWLSYWVPERVGPRRMVNEEEEGADEDEGGDECGFKRRGQLYATKERWRGGGRGGGTRRVRIRTAACHVVPL